MRKIAVSSQSSGGLEDYVSPVLARCPVFTIVEVEDSEIKNVTTVQNPAMTAPMGAGMQAAQMLANQGIEAVIAGNIGPNAWAVLSSLGIKFVQASGIKVREAVEKYIRGELQPATAPTGRGMGAWARPPTPAAPPAPPAPSMPQFQYPQQPYPPMWGPPPLPPEMELQMLESMKRMIEEHLRVVNQRIEQLKRQLGR
ncbi:MAG: dinitrogenase iron-molybdenum cofactor [Thermoproteota archaeon]|nr:MAG: dinitrogenase iron-molybdenum cofactor [Candidatus Korarchaeota archaeon]RLG55116.1 MAG: dinitrogenase iron-molybdenum cofactor [Candidatus Korarchaeota archaeon]